MASSSRLSAQRGSRFMNISRRGGAGRARRDATHREIAVARLLAGCWKFKMGCRKDCFQLCALAEDPDFFTDLLEGETNLLELIAALDASIVDDESLVDGTKALLDKL
jgi:hypothetical protein